MKKRIRQFLPVCLLVCLLLCAHALAEEAAIVSSGKCGTNVEWTLDSEGLLTIFGTGEMSDFSGYENQWNSHDADVLRVVIEKGVTSIGNRAFSECENLASVSIPTGVTSIGEYAFSGCSGLENIEIPESVTRIGYNAFASCPKLVRVTVPGLVVKGFHNLSEGVFSHYFDDFVEEVVIIGEATGIGDQAFMNYGSLVKITIPDSVSYIGHSAFYYCSNLEEIVLPDGVTDIGYDAFYGCSSLERAVLPETLESLGTDAFRSCSSLKEIDIPDNLTYIPQNCFNRCTSLTEVTIPDAVTEIDKQAFYGCSGLKRIHFGSGLTEIADSTFRDCSGLIGVAFPAKLVSIGAHSFRDCTSLKNITIPASVTTIGDYAFYESTYAHAAIYNGVEMTIGESVFGRNSTIYCYNYSSALFYAQEYKYPYSYLDEHDGVTPIYLALPSSFRMEVGTSMTLSADVFPAGLNPTLSWTSSRPEVLSVDNGVITALSVGQSTITVSCGDTFNTVAVSCYADLKSFDLVPDEAWIVSRESLQLQTLNITPAGASGNFSWSSSNTTHLDVSSSGLVSGKVPGDAVVTVTSDTGVSRSCTIHVCYPVTSVAFDNAQLQTISGGVLKLAANVATRDQNYVNKLVSFTSSAPKVASVDADGVVRAHSIGTATITATASSGVSASCTITVREASTLTLPAKLTAIGAEAFLDTAANVVVVGEYCTSIADRAFAGSENLVFIHMPDSVGEIAEDAFEGCVNLTFICESINPAAAYAENNNIPWRLG